MFLFMLVVLAMGANIAHNAAAPINEANLFYPRSLLQTQPVYFKPANLITREEPLVQPMLYHFITEYQPSTLGQNHYIKPGGLVASTINVDSKPIFIRSEGERKVINERNNILYVAYTTPPKDVTKDVM